MMREFLTDPYYRSRSFFKGAVFALFYAGQLIGSVIFFRWLFTDAWNNNLVFASLLFACAEVIAFVSTSLWLFSGLFPLVRPKAIEISFPALDPTTHTLSNSNDNEDDTGPYDADDGVGLQKSPKAIVAVCVCRYKEPLEDLFQTVECMYNIESSYKLQLYILDDGWYSSNDDLKRLQLEGLRRVFKKDCESLFGDLPTFQTTATVYRPDCASECTYLKLLEGSDGHTALTLIARKKPVPDCHFKAGNLNNFLYNFLGDLAQTKQDVPTHLLILDHDMLPHPEIVDDALSILETDSSLAFVQYPQRFHDLCGTDLMHAGNEVFFDGVQNNRGHVGLAAFAGTNAVWRIQALLHVGGLEYDTLTEDNGTAFFVHRLGYTSAYSQRELAVGQSPQSVRDAMQQRMRWSQGATEILMNLMATCFRKPVPPDQWMSPEMTLKFSADPPARPRLLRTIATCIVYLDSIIYPFYAAGFLLHVAVCMIYLITGEAPIAAVDSREILIYWLPLYGVKYSCQLLAFPSVSLAAHWKSQMAWAGYSLSTLWSIWKAVWLRLSKGTSGWFNTGAQAKEVFLLQFGNTVIALVLYLTIVYRGVAFVFVDKTCNAWMSLGSLMYGFVLMFHIQGWAMEPIKALVRSKHSQRGPGRSPSSSVSIPTSDESEHSKKNAALTVAFDKARGHRDHHHALDFSILFVVANVAFFSFILFFWAEHNCDVSSFSPEVVRISDDTDAHITYTPPLPANAKFDVEFSTEGGKVLLNGEVFNIKGANWFGFETKFNVPFGLSVTTQDAVMHKLVEIGVNALRLPLAAGSILSPMDHLIPNSGTIGGDANDHLNATSYLALVETFVDRTASWGVFTLLDMHRLRNDKDNTPYPFDDLTTFEDVKQAWIILAEKFCDSWSVMGADLMNEPWGVTWGDGSPTDWQILAQDLAETVLSVCPKWLIFVEGQWMLDDILSPVNFTDFAPWGGALTAAKEYPIEISDSSKLVYSPHVYGPGSIGVNVVWAPNRNEAQLLCQCSIHSQVIKDLCEQSALYDDFLNVTILRDEASEYCTHILPLPHQPFPTNMENVWDFTFGFLSETNNTVVVGEWGGTYVNPPFKDQGHYVYGTTGPDLTRELEVAWNHAFVAYIVEKGFSSFYWSVNPESQDTGGILLDDWDTIDPAKKWLLENVPSSNPLAYLEDLVSLDELDACLATVGAEQLNKKFGGERYKKESLAYNRALDSDRKKPRAILFPRTEEEIQGIVLCANESAVKVCTRSGGYSYVGDSTCNGVLVDLRHMRQLETDNERDYWIGAGFSLGLLAKEMADRNRLVPTGNHGGVGMGWFLGCGHGFLSRIYGLGCDNIISARMVTAEGNIIEVKDLPPEALSTNVSAHGDLVDTHSDLMWALRGIGSSQLGIVTSIQIQTYPLPPEVHYFRMIWPLEKSQAALELWQDWGMDHPNHNFSVRLSLYSPSDDPVDFNAWYDGIHLDGFFLGSAAEFSELLLPPVKALGEPALFENYNMTYTKFLARTIGIQDADDLKLQVPYVGYSGNRRAFRNLGTLVKGPVSLQNISTIVDLVNTTLPGAKPYDGYLSLYPVGGAASTPHRPSSFSHRDVLSVAQYGGFWDDDPTREESVVRHQLKFRKATREFWGNDAFYNYKDNDLTNWEEAYWGAESVPKLRQLKCRYDPLGVFNTIFQSIPCDNGSQTGESSISLPTVNHDCTEGFSKQGTECLPECIPLVCPVNSFPESTDGCLDSLDECICLGGYAKNGSVCEVVMSCGSILKAELESVSNFPLGEKLDMKTRGFTQYSADGWSDALSIVVMTAGTVNFMEFTWDNTTHVERVAPFYMNGETNGVPNSVPYLQGAGLKFVGVKGCSDDSCDEVCFETTLSLAASF